MTDKPPFTFPKINIPTLELGSVAQGKLRTLQRAGWIIGGYALQQHTDALWPMRCALTTDGYFGMLPDQNQPEAAAAETCEISQAAKLRKAIRLLHEVSVDFFVDGHDLEFEDGDHPLVDRVRAFLAGAPKPEADGYPPLPKGDDASAYVSDAQVFSASEMRAYVDADRALRAAPQAAPAGVPVPDERGAFEVWARSYGTWNVERDDDPALGTTGYKDLTLTVAWHAIQARAALADTPAAPVAQLDMDRVLSIADVHADESREDGVRLIDRGGLVAFASDVLRVATPAADAPAVPKWIDDPHDIEQGQMLNPEWVRQQQPAIMPKGESAAAQLRAMATNYPTGHSWDKLDAKACIRGALEIEALRALLAQAAIAAAPAHPAEGVQAVEQGEVLVTVSGFTGCGKSAIAGEIEILCRALGLQVQWPDGDSEKNMTHADWTEALEQYKPRVRIVEQNIPFASKKGLSK